MRAESIPLRDHRWSEPVPVLVWGTSCLCATEGSVTPPSVPFITVTRCCFLWVLSIHFHTYSAWPFLSGLVVPGPLDQRWKQQWQHLLGCGSAHGLNTCLLVVDQLGFPLQTKVQTRWVSDEVSATEQVFYRFCSITLDLHWFYRMFTNLRVWGLSCFSVFDHHHLRILISVSQNMVSRLHRFLCVCVRFCKSKCYRTIILSHSYCINTS